MKAVLVTGLHEGYPRVPFQPGLSCVNSSEPPSFRRTISITITRASLPVNKRSIRVLAASLVGNPLPEHIKVAEFMNGLKVGPSRTQLFRVRANTMEEAIQIALQEEYIHRQARTSTSVWQDYNASTGAVQRAPGHRASTGQVPMVLGTAVQSSIRCCGKLGHMQRACPAGGQRKFPSKPRGSRGPWQKPRGHQSADGARHGSSAPTSLRALETRKSRGGLLVVRASVRGYGDPFRVLIDSGASTNFARHQTVARIGDKYADPLRESEGRGQV
ncbi:LOW QUALITY PROTEIN: Gag protein [Phytophthora palmivora]|uniref:Gag protein n=1 Tax=Phytophthora palmivora TaxID=4796 RepID=A0A2P4X3X4_9STRA|nr:LOW QUALITY PROTEIN: Gag protein [Phytophthora palmivora]